MKMLKIDFEKPIDLGKAIQIFLTILVALIMFYSTVKEKFAVYDNILSQQQETLQKISDRLDRIQDDITNIKIELENKQNRK